MKSLLATLLLSAAWITFPIGPSEAQAPEPAAVSTLLAALYHPAGSGADLFGLRVAVDGQTAVVGVPLDRDPRGVIGVIGSVQVFVKSGEAWVHQAELLHPAPATGDSFGAAVAIDGDTVVVGARGDESAQVYVRSGTTWTHQAELRLPRVATNTPFFGTSVAVQGDIVVVGAPTDNVIPGFNPHGSVQVYGRSGSTWAHLAELTHPALPSDPAAAHGTDFGFAVALDGGTVVVGARLEDRAAVVDAGAVHVFSTAPWSYLYSLTAPEGGEGDQFGASVAVSGNTVLVGAPFDDTAAGITAGSAHVFVNGAHQAMLVHPAGAASDQFGNSVALSGDLAVVGVPGDDYFTDGLAGGTDAGTAQVFRRSGGAWAFEVELQEPPTPNGGTGDLLGTSVALDGVTAVIGAPRDNNPRGSDAGAAFVEGLPAPVAPTVTTLASSANPSLVGEPVTYTATVDPAEATGVVAFTEDGAPIGGCDAQPLGAGVAACTVSHGAPGERAIVAAYQGDAGFAASTSEPLAQSVLAATATTLSSAPNPSAPGQAVTITAVVTGVPGPPTGSVTFAAGGSVLGTVALDSSGRAEFTLATLPVGTTVVEASYSGDAVHAASTATVTHVVAAPALDCSTALAQPSLLWPPNHRYRSVVVTGVSGPGSGAVGITIDSIRQDEPVASGHGCGHTCPDGLRLGTSAKVRAERSGTGDGRVYHVGFTARDAAGSACSGTVRVCVPHDQGPGAGCVDQGPLHDSTACR